MKIACVGDNCIDFYDETGMACPAETRSMWRCTPGAWARRRLISVRSGRIVSETC